jgi:hypothetical protein
VIGILVLSALGGTIPLTVGVMGREGSTAILALSGLRLLLRRCVPTQLPFLRGRHSPNTTS